MQIRKQSKLYDAVVIGSGASGGMAAWNLTRQGVNVLLLDAGDKFDRAGFWTHVLPYEARERRARGERPPEFYLSETEQPYLTPPGQPFKLVRVWGIGGKTNVWGRVSLRYGDVDFKVNDGYGVPWPFEYRDIKPYYDKVDQLIGVNGGDDDQDVLPGSAYHMPPPPPRCGEVLLRKAAARAGIGIVSGRRAVLTRPLNGWPACHYCGRCGSGCDTGSFFNSADHLIPVALGTGRIEIRSNAVVARILADKEGRASGVQYFDRKTRQEYQVRARVVVLGASCIDSTRILLNSKSDNYPNGIGNTSGVIGKYLTEQVRFHARAFLPNLYGQPTTNDDGIGGEHIYMPRFNHRDGRKRDYARGYGMQFWGIGCQAGAGWSRGLPGFGPGFKRDIKKRYPAWVELHPYGEVVPVAENRVEVDETRLDPFGVPLPRIIFKYGENEMKMVDEMYDTVERILHEAKAEIYEFRRGSYDTPGNAIHEHGTCRMGADPKTSALDGFCRMHAVKNLFVVDGSAFPSATEKNPTLTILALAWRATDYLAAEMKKGNL
ncbi:MAG: GMC family oxidoreductase [Acidobacteriota bacterium]|nr:MAG: GMC family oxidoreductase [Acidobacteriota bacterium]